MYYQVTWQSSVLLYRLAMQFANAQSILAIGKCASTLTS